MIAPYIHIFIKPNMRQATLYASFLQGWDAYAAALTDDEKAVSPGGRVGVYRAASRKAWLVHEASAYDPKGTIFFLR